MNRHFSLYLIISIIIHLVLLGFYSFNLKKTILHTNIPEIPNPIKITLKNKIIIQSHNNQKPEKANYLGKNNTTSKETKGKKGEKISFADLSISDDFSKNPALFKKQNNNSSKTLLGEEVGEGSDLQTSLNSKEHVYYSYFARMKIKLDNVWQLKVRDEIRRLVANGDFFVKDKITKIMITLNEQGKLESAKVILPSGYYQLDDTALSSFRLAEPFPNPPKGLIEEDGKIRITWSFIIYD